MIFVRMCVILYVNILLERECHENAAEASDRNGEL